MNTHSRFGSAHFQHTKYNKSSINVSLGNYYAFEKGEEDLFIKFQHIYKYITNITYYKSIANIKNILVVNGIAKQHDILHRKLVKSLLRNEIRNSAFNLTTRKYGSI